jgi:DNA-binding transcriptional LysR family regulator
MVAVAPPGHPLSRRRKVSVEELCRQPFVVRETGAATRSLVERALAERGLTVRPVMSLGSTEAIKRAVAAGVGVAVVSGLSAGLELRAGTLTRLNVTGLTIRRPVTLVRVRGRHASPAAAAFIQLVKEHVAAKP